MTFRPTEQFVEDYERLPRHLQQRADKMLAVLLTNLRYPSLRAKKMEGQRDPEGRDIWEARISRSHRFTFAQDADTYILYRIGPHDIERHPR